jgi:signal recognition particle subunit SRP54
MTGQDAVNVAQQFQEQVQFDGVILTKLDGDARGGAALSVRAVTGKPIKFASTGEKLDNFEYFHPDRMASRILGMGDMLSLIERAEMAVDEKKAKELEKRLRKAQFTFDDFLDQLQQVKKMGSLSSILGMIPGVPSSKLKGLQIDDNAFDRIQAIIHSMTPEERRHPDLMNGSRRRRIAAGSGSDIHSVNQLLTQFKQMQKMMKQLGSGRLPKNPFQGFGL